MTFFKFQSKISRLHRVASALVSVGVFAFSASCAWAQSYPNKPVKVVVAFTAGGTTDILARMVAQQLTEKLKQPFVIDNKPGAGGNLGTEVVVRAPADGYTLLVNSVGPIAVNPTFYGKLAYNTLTDLVPVVQCANTAPPEPVILPFMPALESTWSACETSGHITLAMGCRSLRPKSYDSAAKTEIVAGFVAL